MRTLGEFLNHKGYSVLGVRLAGHATRPKDMIGSNWTEWTASVEDGYHLLRGVADHIYLIGLSMGGALSLLMSTQVNVNAVICISTPAQLAKDWRLNFTEWIGRFKPYLRKTPGPPGNGWVDPEAWRDHISYLENPTRSIGQLKILLGEMRAVLAKIDRPVLLIHSRDDRYVMPENMENIFAGLINSPDKTKIYITGSGHVATLDAARNQVFQAIYEFIARQESSRPQIRNGIKAQPGRRGWV